MDSIIEQYVFMVDDKEIPYRLVGNLFEDDHYEMCLWESSDGIEFKNKKVLFNEQHDTQQVMIPRGNELKLYTRIWENNERKNRRLAVAFFNMSGNQKSNLSLLDGDYLYNSAASKLNSQFDILFPTFYNNRDVGGSDSCYVKNYVVDGTNTRELPCGFNKWIESTESWVIIAPGFIKIGGGTYLAYNTRTKSHDSSTEGVVSKYKLIKIEID